MSTAAASVIVVGAGLVGAACARTLARAALAHRPRARAVDDLDAPPVACTGQPVQHGLGRRESPRVARGNAELDEGDEAPVRASPLLVRVATETAVGALTLQEPADDRPGEDRAAPTEADKSPQAP